MGGEIVRIAVNERANGAPEQGVPVDIVHQRGAGGKQDVAHEHDEDEKMDLGPAA